MRLSQNFTKTRKDAPADEKSKNAQLLIKAGYIYKDSAGIYGYLPLGIRVINKIKEIVREEIDSVGGQELILTSLQRKELWERTGRWDEENVDVWFKSALRNGTEVGFGWSHEEQMIDMVRVYVSSYRDLPFSIYQFQTKMRNETRAKSGIMRTREFVMKDQYSFAKDDDEHKRVYDEILGAYRKVYDRIGIGDITYFVFAAGGAFTKYSHEFQTLCENGEDLLYQVPNTDTYYNGEIAPATAPPFDNSDDDLKDIEEVEGKGIIGVEPLAKFLNIPVELTTKTLLFEDDKGNVIAAAVRGGYNVSQLKLQHALNAEHLKLASAETVRRVTNAGIGYAGLINLPKEVLVIMDDSMKGRKNFEMGANKTNYHSKNVNFGRDLDEPEEYFDIKEAKPGDLDPESGSEYLVHKAAEVGNTFSFGTEKCEKLDLYYVDEDGKRKPVVLGSYGIGITRLMGVVAEVMADDKGLVWPEALAPASVQLISLGVDEAVTKAADELFDQLESKGINVIYDDRDVRGGEKLADADLMGMPYRVVVSAKTLEQGKLELKKRTENETKMVSEEELIAQLS